MIWKTYEFQGIITLDKSLINQLVRYLENKESALAKQITEAIHPLKGESLPPLLTPASNLELRLHEAVEGFSKKIQHIAHTRKQIVSNADWQSSVKQIKAALWEYVEVLEECSIELFQQVDQLGFEQWQADMVSNVSEIKDILTHHMEDCIWAIRRLEKELKIYRGICEKRQGKWMFWRQMLNPFQRLLDRILEANLIKSQKFLGFRFQKMNDKFAGFLQLYKNVERTILTFFGYKVLSSLELEAQDEFKKMFLLLKIWEQNRSTKTLSIGETERALRSTINPDSAIEILKDYFFHLKAAIFEKSRMIKKRFQGIFADAEGKSLIIETLIGYQKELGTLKDFASHYRSFLQHTSSITTKTTFLKTAKNSKREIRQSEDLIFLKKEIDDLDSIAESFSYSIKNEVSPEKSRISHVRNRIDSHLHEMGQPLASRSAMRDASEKIVNLLYSLDELASYDSEVVDYITEILIKTMKLDWRYHGLQEIPFFHRLYFIHHGILEPIDDRQHTNRLYKFKKIIGQLEAWIDSHETLLHAHEISLDLSDLKGYLQDFLGSIQRISQDTQLEDDTISRKVTLAKQMLLEYRYLFGNFFHRLSYDVPEQKLLRKQMLFVDQYFESIETRIHESAPT